MKLYPFYNAITHLKTFYDITLEDDEFENIGLHAWDLIGNKYTRTYKHVFTCTDGILELPCNVDVIEVITGGQEQYQSTDNVSVDDFSRQYIEQYVQAYQTHHHSLYSPGGMLTYSRVGDTLHLDNKNLSTVFMIYKGVELDENGLPSLNVKEVAAIATYCAYVTLNKRGMTARDQATIQLAQMLKQDWQRMCDNARTPMYLNQNEMDQILDVKGSWDRKRYGISLKLYR